MEPKDSIRPETLKKWDHVQTDMLDMIPGGTISATEMTGIAPAGIFDPTNEDAINQLWPHPNTILGADLDTDPMEEEDS